MAILDGTRFKWSIELDGSDFHIQEEDTRSNYIDKNGTEWCCFLFVDPPDGAKEAALKAIPRARS